jgi:hypothetical protein
VVDGTGEAAAQPLAPLGCLLLVIRLSWLITRACPSLPQLLMYALGGCWLVNAHPAGMIDNTVANTNTAKACCP